MQITCGCCAGRIFGAALSWITTCGVIALLSLCFSFTYSWAVATGIWLIAYTVLTIIYALIRASKKQNKE